MNPKTFIFIGRSGCGKGTQAVRLSEYLKKTDPAHPIQYIETGERFRKFIAGESAASKRANAIYERAERQPDFLAIWMWSSFIVDELSENEHLIIDGTPRSKDEAEVLLGALNFLDRKDVHVVYLNVSKEWSLARLSERGRVDDTSLAKREKRLAWFDTDVIPAVEFLQSASGVNFHDINGERTRDEVEKEMLEKVFSL